MWNSYAYKESTIGVDRSVCTMYRINLTKYFYRTVHFSPTLKIFREISKMRNGKLTQLRSRILKQNT